MSGLPPHIFAEIAAGFPVLRLAADGLQEIAAEEEEHVEQAEHDRHPDRARPHDERPQIDQRIDNGQILHLDGQDHKQENLFVGEHRGEREEEREVEIGVVRVSCDQAGQDGAEHTHAVIEIKAHLTPAAFQTAAYEIVEIQRKEHEERRSGWGREDKGDKPPDLPVQDCAA